MQKYKYLEDVLSGMETLLKAQLNTVITNMNTCHNDGNDMLTIDTANYIFDSSELVDQKVYVELFMGQDAEIDFRARRGAISPVLFVTINFTISDDGNNKADYIKALRYLDALNYVLCQKDNGYAYDYEATAMTPAKTNYEGMQMFSVGIALKFKFA